MNTSSILTNSSALTALQSLDQTEQALSSTQNEISTGLSVGSAADNASYWSIATQLSSNSGTIGAVNDALAQSQSALDTATSALNSIITTIGSINTALTQATNPTADLAAINTTLASLGAQLSDAVQGASFNGLNLLNGSQTTLNFVSGFNQGTAGATINTIAFTAQALTGTGTTSSTTQGATVTNAATITALTGLADNTTAVTAPSYGQDMIDTTTDTTGDTFSVSSMALDGTVTKTTYTGLDANGNVVAAVGAASLGVSITTTPPAGMLTQGGANLTSLNVSSAADASTKLNDVQAALTAITSYSSTIGSTQDRMTAASTLNSSLQTDYTNGVSSLVDADMNQASTRLQALQTQQQLGIQSLSIANQNSQLILKLFQG